MTKLILTKIFFDFFRSRLIDCEFDDSMRNVSFDAFRWFEIFFFDWFRWNHFVRSHRCYFDWFDLNRLKLNFFRYNQIWIRFDKMIWLKWFWISLIRFKIRWLLIFFLFLTNCTIFVMCLCDLQRFFETSKLMNSTKNRISRSLKIRYVC